MPRKPRKQIIAPQKIYHIVVRGNNQRRIFRSSRDYNKLKKILEQVKKEKPFYLYRYSFLPNHFHLEIETIDISVSEIMHRVNFLYAIYFRHRYKTSGHLFQARFFSSIVEKEPYFWAVARYIDLNPVKAGIVEEPEDYLYGSFRYYAEKECSEKLIDREKFLQYEGESAEQARINYFYYVKEGVESLKKDKLPKFINKNLE